MKITSALASTTLLLSAFALANEPVTFSSLDTDRNGVLDKAESSADPNVAEKFEAADADQDGKLSQEEFAYAMADLESELDPGEPS